MKLKNESTKKSNKKIMRKRKEKWIQTPDRLLTIPKVTGKIV